MTSKRRVLSALALLISVIVSGCATTDSPETLPTPAHDNMDSTVWLQASTEYAAVTTGIYKSATAAIEEIARANPGGTSDMAIVMDIDETVLDNSRYQAQLVLDDTSYNSETWDKWVALRAADAVPGVVEFIRTSQALGFHVAFITNRRCRTRPDATDECPQIEDTRRNLEDVGINTVSTTLFIRGDSPLEECQEFLTAAERDDGTWSGDKTSRRDCVAVSYDIIMLFGDQLGDFTEEHDDSSAESGRDLAASHAENWGKTWFMLPNPTYGGWRPREHAEKRELIRGVD